MRAVRDDAASPLVVIATFLVIAVGVTSLVFLLFVDLSRPYLEVEQEGRGAETVFRVTELEGDHSWADLTIMFLDRAGGDHADSILLVPGGAVDVGDTIALTRLPAAGQYLLQVDAGDDILARLLVTL